MVPFAPSDFKESGVVVVIEISHGFMPIKILWSNPLEYMTIWQASKVLDADYVGIM